ncbi:hypothetical protein LXL04_001351 [Taraxacum kok-saghyz]
MSCVPKSCLVITIFSPGSLSSRIPIPHTHPYVPPSPLFNPHCNGFQSGHPRNFSVPGTSEMYLIPKLGKMFFVSQHSKPNQAVEVIDTDNNVVRCKDGLDAVSLGTKLQPDHLVIMGNGIIGNATDWEYAAKQFVKRLPDKIVVYSGGTYN